MWLMPAAREASSTAAISSGLARARIVPRLNRETGRPSPNGLRRERPGSGSPSGGTSLTLPIPLLGL